MGEDKKQTDPSPGRFRSKTVSEMLRNVSLLTQLGLSFVTPLLVCLLFCSWLAFRFSLGGWIYIPGFFFGLGGSFTVAYKFYKAQMAQEKKSKKKPVSYNRHV